MASFLASTMRRGWTPWVAKAAGAGAFCVLGNAPGYRQFAACDGSHTHQGHVHVHSHSHSPDGHTHKSMPDGHTHKSMPSKFDHAHSPDTTPHLLFGVPKKGRLYETVTKLLKGAGIEYQRKERLDIAHCSNLPVSIVFLPAGDIADYVGEGDVDLGITGEDVVAESETDVTVLMQLGFGKCNLSVQAPKDHHVQGAEALAGKRIVTSFPKITRKFFEQYEEAGKPTQIKRISGSVEASCGLGLADGIVDLVETGTTMRAAGLEEVAVVMQSQTVLIKNPHTKHPELVELIRQRIVGYLTAQSWVMVTYNVNRKDLKAAEKITPGKRSPSVQPLEDPAWVAVAALVPKKKAAEIMDELADVGAQDILLTRLLSSRIGD